MTGRAREILIEGLSAKEVLALPDDHVAALIASGPIVFRVGSASVLGHVQLPPGRLIVELAQIDGGGEGVLLMLWLLAERYAQQRGLHEIEWIVHAVTCAQPNRKLLRLLQKRGFMVREIEGVGQAYHRLHKVKSFSHP